MCITSGDGPSVSLACANSTRKGNTARMNLRPNTPGDRPVPRGYNVHPLPWRPCSKGDGGAVWTGARWTCPPFGPGHVIVAAAGIIDRTRRALPAVSSWRPWWDRPAGAPAPHQHGPRVLLTIRGDQDGLR